MKKIYHVEPVLESFVWAGDKITDYYGYQTTMTKVGQAYHVIALPDHLDNIISETKEHLSEFFKRHPELFLTANTLFSQSVWLPHADRD